MAQEIKIKKEGQISFGFSITGGHPSPVVVSKLRPGSPADKCPDIHVGDVIDSINGKSLSGLSQVQVVTLVKQSGTEITLVVRPADFDYKAPGARTPESQRRVIENARSRAQKEMGSTAPKPTKPIKPVKPVKPTKPEMKATSAAPSSSLTATTTEDAELQARLGSALDRIAKAASALGVSTNLDVNDLSTVLPLIDQLEKVSISPSASSSDLGALQAVVKRLESLAPSGSSSVKQGSGTVMQRLVQVVERLEKCVLGSSGSSSVSIEHNVATLSGSGDDESVPSLDAYDEFLQTQVKAFLEASQKIGGDVAEGADFIKNAFIAQRRFLEVVPRSRKPGPKVLPDLMQAQSECIMAVSQFREAKRTTKSPNHLAAMAEGIGALGWVTVEPKPSPYVRDMKEACEFYTNRVIKDFKGSDDNQVQWARAWVSCLQALFEYVKKHHTTGLAWGNKIRSMTFWSNAIATTAPGEGDADKYIFSTRLGVPVSHA